MSVTKEPAITEERIIMNNTTRKPVAGIITAIIVGVLAIGGVAAALVVMLGPVSASATSSSQGDSRRVVVQPSAMVKHAQEQLAQLDYYTGPIDGYLNRETGQAIIDLQRFAYLPETGQLDHGTRVALEEMVQQGNSRSSGLSSVDGVHGERHDHPVGTTCGVELPEGAFGRPRSGGPRKPWPRPPAGWAGFRWTRSAGRVVRVIT